MSRWFVPRGRSPLERFLRTFLLFGVFGAVIFLYDRYYQGVMEDIASRGAVYDQTGSLSPRDKRLLRELSGEMRRRFGLELKVSISDAPPAPGGAEARVVTLYVRPDCTEALAAAPPLIAKALPEGTLAGLAEDHLLPACRAGEVRTGVLEAAGLLYEALREAAGQKEKDGG